MQELWGRAWLDSRIFARPQLRAVEHSTLTHSFVSELSGAGLGVFSTVLSPFSLSLYHSLISVSPPDGSIVLLYCTSTFLYGWVAAVRFTRLSLLPSIRSHSFPVALISSRHVRIVLWPNISSSSSPAAAPVAAAFRSCPHLPLMVTIHLFAHCLLY